MKFKVTKYMLNIALIIIVFAAGSAVTATVIQNLFHFNQNLTIPADANITVYQSDGVSQLASGTNLTQLWQWNNVTGQFTLQLVIKNTGNTVVYPGLNTTNVPASWAVSIAGNNMLTQGTTETVTLTAVPPSTVGNISSGNFDLWITG